MNPVPAATVHPRAGLPAAGCGAGASLCSGHHGFGYSRAVVRAVLLSLALAACAQPRSAACKAICAREAECQRTAEDEKPDEQNAFDEGDCVAACAALERDGKTKPNVEAHRVCLQKAGNDCEAVLKCH